MVGIDADGTITGLRVTGHSETAGLGAKATDPSFYEQFTGKSGSVSVTKDGGEIVPSQVQQLLPEQFVSVRRKLLIGSQRMEVLIDG